MTLSHLRIFLNRKILIYDNYNLTETFPDFTGTLLKTVTRHKKTSVETEVVIAERFVYDHQNRLKKHYHQVDSRPEVLLGENTYDELGRLVKKNVGDNLQEINYAYNIRGWITNINNVDNIGNDLFAYKIHYNSIDGKLTNRKPYVADQSLEVKEKYNGNISHIEWLTADPADSSREKKTYGYSYDGLNRLKAGFYYKEVSGNYSFTEENNEILGYDINGNISKLDRFAYKINNVPSKIDGLQYFYSGNRLLKITDAQSDANGYEGGGADIGYDSNGNMTSMPDKAINSITYNYLNLPNAMDMGGGKRKASNDVLYRADGVKLKKSYTSQQLINNGNWGTVTSTTLYLDGFQYLDAGSGKLTTGSVIGEDSDLDLAMEREAFRKEETAAIAPGAVPGGTSDVFVLQFVPTAEGYYSFTENRYIYQYKDHLGNTRASYARNSAGGTEMTDKNNYYPFGMNHLDSDSGSFFGQGSYKNYKYQGQELQETGFYSFKWRNYMPDVGRFFNIDPLAEQYTYNSTYAFQENKMGLGRELKGLELRQDRGMITATGMTENDIYTTEPLPSYMSSYVLHPDKPDPQLMDVAELPSGAAGMGKWNDKDGSFYSFAGEANATKALGIFEVIKLVKTGIDGVKGMEATAENVKAVNYMGKLVDQFKDMQTAQDVVSKADLKLDNKTKTEVTNYIFNGSLPKDVNSRSNSVVNLGSKANIVNTANSIMRKNDIIVRNSPEVKKRQQLEQQRMEQQNKQQNVGR